MSRERSEMPCTTTRLRSCPKLEEIAIFGCGSSLLVCRAAGVRWKIWHWGGLHLMRNSFHSLTDYNAFVIWMKVKININFLSLFLHFENIHTMDVNGGPCYLVTNVLPNIFFSILWKQDFIFGWTFYFTLDAHIECFTMPLNVILPVNHLKHIRNIQWICQPYWLVFI